MIRILALLDMVQNSFTVCSECSTAFQAVKAPPQAGSPRYNCHAETWHLKPCLRDGSIQLDSSAMKR